MPFESATAAVQMLIAASGSEAAQGGLVPLNFNKVGFYLALLVGCGLFAAIMGLASSWVDRKVTALVQARVGPRVTQPLWDLLKLLGKETVIPEGANRLTFVLMPLAALAAVALAATILLANVLWQNGLLPSYYGLSQYGTVGDLIVVLYLLAVPSLALVIGASSSNNPFASVGASREMKLMSYELPLLLAVAVALVLGSTTERRFTDALQKQVDARMDATAPFVSKGTRQAEAATCASQLSALEHSLRVTVEREGSKALRAQARRVAILRSQVGEMSRAGSAAQAGDLIAKQAELGRQEQEFDSALAKEFPDEAESLKQRRYLGRRIQLLQEGPSDSLSVVVPLRFDQLLALRGASPEAEGRLRVDLAEARVKSQISAWRSVIGVDLQETDRELEALSRERRQLLSLIEGAPAAGRGSDLDNKLRLVEARIWLDEARRARLGDRGLLLAVEESRLYLARAERFQKALQLRPSAGRSSPAREDLQRYDRGLEKRREDLKAEFAKLARRDLVGTSETANPQPARAGPLFLDGPALCKAVAADGLARFLALCALGLCVAVAVMCAQAKLGLVPFDCAEAETEIAGGVLIEYGGPLLGAWKLARQMLLFVMPVFIGMVFLGGFRFFVPGAEHWYEHLGQAAVSLVKYVGILVVFILVRNTNPRVRIDQAMRFFLGPMTVLAVLALGIAVFIFHVLA